ncbi:RIP metalloprotease RseP [Saccharophagus sp. K07]|jgi:regulator of sigma E protease|uniref:RIP metalloprotease RseP n=1 Tax=Saccharophagus sp. K07 TaxID=2283636 RepID=UPI0016524B38|nr:RIP metalloprotease RseP [Saccharophagus sp. K07]MBC6904698.1 RIP metalloprotease RseP [Saccharophagus sp. K07]
MDLIQTIAGFLVALFILVSVHEFGHFYVARLCGVKVLRFCIGMGKPFWSFRDRHGTEFGLAPIPLGGYVKMLDEREVDVPPEERHLSYNGKSVWQRIAILSAGPLANFLLALVIFFVLLLSSGSVGIAPVVGLVEKDSPADKAGLEIGQEIVAVDGVPTPTSQAVMERLFMRLGETGILELRVRQTDSDLYYDLNIPLSSWLSDARDPNPIEGLGFDFYLRSVIFGDAQPGTPAERAGLKAGDVLRTVNGEVLPGVDHFIKLIRSSVGQPLDIEVRRNDETVRLSVVPEMKTLDDGTQVGQIGVALGYGPWPQHLIRQESYGPLKAMWLGFNRTIDTSVFVLVSLKKLIVGEISTKNLSGPIGIAKVAGDHARAGLVYFVEFLAILSVYLGVLNLLPIPVLDGGHILYSIAEAIKGSPLSERVQMFGYSLGLVILAGVMVMAFYNDLLRL